MHPSIPDHLASIMQAGVLAPSADNRHCFEFRITQDGIVLSGDSSYASAPYHRRVLNRISIGAVVENMVIRAARLGYRAELHWLAERSEPSPIVEVKLYREAPRETPLDAAIATRHTNRRVVFSGPKLSEPELKVFAQLAQDIPGVALDFFDSGPRRDALLRLAWRAEAERFGVRSLHDDLFSAVRFDVGWNKSATEGLPPAALGVEPGMRWAFAQLRHWPVMNALRSIGLHRVLGFRAASLPCRLAPHRGVLTTTLSLEQGAVAVGRAMQRIWLEAARRGLAFQPLAGAALLALPGYEAVRPATGERLRRGWKALTAETPLMVFRMGYARAGDLRAGRKSWESFLGN